MKLLQEFAKVGSPVYWRSGTTMEVGSPHRERTLSRCDDGPRRHVGHLPPLGQSICTLARSKLKNLPDRYLRALPTAPTP